jgi:hypothetical protein
MKRGKDFAVEIPKLSFPGSLFRFTGLPGLILWFFQISFLNFSILSVAFVGLAWQRTIASLGVFVFAFVVFGLGIRISQLWNNLSVLASTEEHLSRYSDCNFEVLSNATFRHKYGFQLFYRLVSDPKEVTSFFIRTSRPNKEMYQAKPDDSKLKSLAQELVSDGLSFGNQFIICLHPGPKKLIPAEFSAFASRDFGFVFLPAEKYGLSRLRQFIVAHEVGHLSMASISSYFKAEGMMRCIIVIPFLISYIKISLVSVSIIISIFVFYLYLRYKFYPSRIAAPYFRDEVNADRYAVWSLPIANLDYIAESTGLYKIVKMAWIGATPQAAPAQPGEAPARNGELNELEQYRYDLIREEIEYRKAGKPFNLYQLISLQDRQKRAVAFSGNQYEGFIGVGLAVLAFWFYELSSYSVLLSACITAVYGIAVVILCNSVKTRYKRVAALLEQRCLPTSGTPS